MALAPVAALRRLVGQLDETQWATYADIAASQSRHLVRLAGHCSRRSPFFARRLARAGLEPHDLGDPHRFGALPVLTRREWQTARDFYCTEWPGGGHVFENRTSGSTGEPVVVRKTSVSHLFWCAMSLREHGWHKRDLAGRLCVIRAPISRPVRRADWGPPASAMGQTGPFLGLPIAGDAAALAESLIEFQPEMVSTYPNTLNALARYFQDTGRTLPGLRHILTSSETLTLAIRTEAEVVFGVPIEDNYSSEEVGIIAIQCPVSGLYHVMSESVIAEVLDDSGRPCGPGEVGRVTLTDLHNYATPVIRYDIGDFAEVARPCRCGRGLPTWKRILGRERNLLVRPDGTRHWPVTGFPRAREIAPVLQFQLVQEDLETIEARLVVERPLSPAEEDRLRTLFNTQTGHAFRMRFTYFADRIPCSSPGKFEEFVCNVRHPGTPAAPPAAAV